MQKFARSRRNRGHSPSATRLVPSIRTLKKRCVCLEIQGGRLAHLISIGCRAPVHRVVVTAARKAAAARGDRVLQFRAVALVRTAWNPRAAAGGARTGRRM